MKQFALVAAALLAWSAAMPGWAAGKSAAKCTPSATAEAEQAIRYMTDLMVASSACKNSVYAEFALRNRTAIIRYQKAMITHLHGAKAFDTWDTRLANEASQRQAAVPAVQFCQEVAPLMQQAGALDIKGFQDYAVTHAATAVPADPKCAK